MKKVALITFILTISLLMSACGLIGNTAQPSSTVTDDTQASAEVTADTESGADSATPSAETDNDVVTPSDETGEQADEASEPTESDNTSGETEAAEPSASEAVTDDPEPQTPLTQEELDFFTEYFSVYGNNEFLLSDYDSPADIDLFELFYVGAGIEGVFDSLPQEEVDAYLAAIGNNEVCLNLMKLTQQQVTDFLYEKTGKVFPPTNELDGWIYLEQYDAFYKEVSDTNYNFLICDSGYMTSGGLYVIHFTAEEGYGQLVASCTTTLYKDDDNYLIVSNELVTSY